MLHDVVANYFYIVAEICSFNISTTCFVTMQTKPNFEHVVDILTRAYPKSIFRESIRAMYLFGSHLYGTASPISSDFDLFILHDSFRYLDDKKDIIGRDATNEIEILVSVKSDAGHEIEAHLYDTRAFMSLMRIFDAVPTVIIFEHDDFVWYEDPIIRKYRTFWLSKLNLQHSAIKRSTYRESHLICFRKAKRLFPVNKLKSKKNIVHGLRYLTFGNQIVRNDRIIDYSCANKYYYEILENNHETWEQYQNEYMILYDQLQEELASYTTEKHDMAVRETKYDPEMLQRSFEHDKYVLQTILFVESHGMIFFNL
jgi:predicted nucleotidyltransferase